MSVKCGIVGLPNVGKSTLFNALTNKNVAAENFPFCTIDPNIGIAPINDIRLKKIANIVNSKKIIKTFIEFIDIAGLIQGSYKGEGLGNKFLNNIQNTDAVIHVVRAFNDTNIAHIYDNVQPISDIEIINMELILFDLNICESRILTIEKKIKTQDSLLKKEILVLQNCISYLKKFIMLRTLDLDASEKLLINHLRLLTLKPMMYVVNVNNKVHHNISSLEPIYELAKKEHTKVITLCAKNEK
ncbi:MAG TPA: GTPase, partial [Buchnera sp. (in: enterobacteria)]|nr:GTPase [Buchnera sp. (in: enterobacteria)]